MPVEGLGPVLGEHEDLAQAGVDRVAQREIDEAEFAGKGHRRLGALAGKRLQTLAGPAGHDDAEDSFHAALPGRSGGSGLLIWL